VEPNLRGINLSPLHDTWEPSAVWRWSFGNFGGGPWRGNWTQRLWSLPGIV